MYAKHIASLIIMAITQHLCWLSAIPIHHGVKLCWKVSAYMAFLISKALVKHEHLLFTTTIDLLKLPIWQMTNQIIVIMPLVISEKKTKQLTTNIHLAFTYMKVFCSQLNASQSQGLKQLYGQFYTEHILKLHGCVQVQSLSTNKGTKLREAALLRLLAQSLPVWRSAQCEASCSTQILSHKTDIGKQLGTGCVVCSCWGRNEVEPCVPLSTAAESLPLWRLWRKEENKQGN